MANEKKNVTLVLPCAIELKTFRDDKTGNDTVYISISTLYHDETFRFKIDTDNKLLRYFMKKDGYAITDSEGNVVDEKELRIRDRTAELRAKLSGRGE